MGTLKVPERGRAEQSGQTTMGTLKVPEQNRDRAESGAKQTQAAQSGIEQSGAEQT